MRALETIRDGSIVVDLTIQLTDVNGDGKQDVCARAAKGIECFLPDVEGFPTKMTGPAWSKAAGWDAEKPHGDRCDRIGDKCR